MEAVVKLPFQVKQLVLDVLEELSSGVRGKDRELGEVRAELLRKLYRVLYHLLRLIEVSYYEARPHPYLVFFKDLDGLPRHLEGYLLPVAVQDRLACAFDPYEDKSCTRPCHALYHLLMLYYRIDPRETPPFHIQVSPQDLLAYLYGPFGVEGEVIVHKPYGSYPEPPLYLLDLIDYGLEEIEEDVEPQENGEDKDIVRIFGEFTSFGELTKALEDKGIEVKKATIEYIANTPVDLSDKQLEEIEALIDKLEDDEDVQNVYTNIN